MSVSSTPIEHLSLLEILLADPWGFKNQVVF